MSNFLEELRKYFEVTPKKTIFEDWAKYNTQENNVGLTVGEFLKHYNSNLYEFQSISPHGKSSPQFSIAYSKPEETSGFFYLNI